MTHICVGKLTIIGSDNGLSPDRRQAIIWTNAGWIIVNWTLANIFQWKFNQNTAIFIEENAHENIVCEMAFTLSRPQGVKVVLYITSLKIPTSGRTFYITGDRILREEMCNVKYCSQLKNGYMDNFDSMIQSTNIVARDHIYAPVNWVIINLGNTISPSPVRRLAIIWTRIR